MPSHKITIEIETGNDAFEHGNECYEVARILRKAADRIADHSTIRFADDAKLFDVNGNRVGKVTVTRL